MTPEPEYVGADDKGQPWWYVSSSSTDAFVIQYLVILTKDGYRCDCRAGRFHTACKHVGAVKQMVQEASAALA